MTEHEHRFEPKHVVKPWGYEIHWAVTDPVTHQVSGLWPKVVMGGPTLTARAETAPSAWSAAKASSTVPW